MPAPVFGQPHDLASLSNRYFVVVWAYEGDAPRESHTFATFYKGDDLANGRIKDGGRPNKAVAQLTMKSSRCATSYSASIGN
jgi:hypothetical protein